MAISLSGVLLFPLLWPMHQILRQHAFKRPAAVVASLSATGADWLNVRPAAVHNAGSEKQQPSRALSPGWLRVVLAVIAMVTTSRSPHRQFVWFLTALGACAFLLSFGLNFQLGTWQPWRTLTEWIPGLAHIRSVFRFAYFVQLVVILLAAIALDRFARHDSISSRLGRTSWIRHGLLLVLGGLVAFEVPPAAVQLVSIPNVSIQRPWTKYLRARAVEAHSIICLPMPTGYSVQEFDQTTRWMLYATQHTIPMVNGYSGFFPNSYFQLAKLVAADPFAQPTLRLLAQRQVDYLIVHRRRMTLETDPTSASDRLQLKLVFRDAEADVWQLVDTGSDPPMAP